MATGSRDSGIERARGRQGGEQLEFPDLPRLELDVLLEELRDRADDVLAVQGRLRGLLRANAGVTAELSLPAVLKRLAEAARDLLSVRYAALGVIGWDGRLEQFVHTGMAPELVEKIGHLPRGDGILGLLIRDPVPIRLADLGSHAASSGFPAEHPPMRTFLGVPIRVGDAVFGNLYVTERIDGAEFSAEDEELATALAVTAGGAIANARLFTESQQSQRWLSASAALTTKVLTDDAQEPLSLVIEAALAAAEADFCTLVKPHGDTEVIVATATGVLATDLIGRTAPLTDSLAGEAIRTGQANLVTDYSALPGADRGLRVGPLMILPLADGHRARGALILGRLPDTTRFDEMDLKMAAAFASQAAIALELLESRQTLVDVARMQDRERIAADLHDQVIQDLFAVGMGLQSMMGSLINQPAQRARLDSHVDTIDTIIKNIRTLIFQLRRNPADIGGLKAAILDLVSRHTAQLGFSPTVRFVGPLDTAVDDTLAEDILAVVGEATSNCARHAHATRVAITAELSEMLTIEVVDNGRGISTPDHLSGLENLRRRAEKHHGTLDVTTPDSGGTRLLWTAQNVPVAHPRFC